jgi:hypothetical protein
MSLVQANTHEVGEIEPFAPRPVMQFAMTPAQAQQWAHDVAEMKRSVLRDGADFMVIPGTDKPSLLQPGAEILLLAAGFGFTNNAVQDDAYRAHEGVTYQCVVTAPDGTVKASCDGYAGYDESRFFTSEAESRAKEEFWARKDGRPVNERKIAEYRAPWNSVIKMAQKRALVGATKSATASSGIFTQDMEDTAPAALLFDSGALVRPCIADLTKAQQKELADWAKAIQPRQVVDKLTPEQAALWLIHIGVIISQSSGGAPASSADPGVQLPAEDPEGIGDNPSTPEGSEADGERLPL